MSGVSDGVSVGSDKPGVIRVQPADKWPPTETACMSPEMHALHLNHFNTFTFNSQHLIHSTSNCNPRTRSVSLKMKLLNTTGGKATSGT